MLNKIFIIEQEHENINGQFKKVSNLFYTCKKNSANIDISPELDRSTYKDLLKEFLIKLS